MTKKSSAFLKLSIDHIYWKIALGDPTTTKNRKKTFLSGQYSFGALRLVQTLNASACVVLFYSCEKRSRYKRSYLLRVTQVWTSLYVEGSIYDWQLKGKPGHQEVFLSGWLWYLTIKLIVFSPRKAESSGGNLLFKNFSLTDYIFTDPHRPDLKTVKTEVEFVVKIALESLDAEDTANNQE